MNILPILGDQLRLYQWLKNSLVFLPLFLAHKYNQPDQVMASLFGFAAFCFVASAVYCFNDVRDFESDRMHPEKQKRPLAAGKISRRTVGLIGGTSLVIGLCLGLWISQGVLDILLLYVATNFLYTKWIKRLPILDVFCLASFYSLRMILGGVATGVVLSPWLLAFSTFLFFSLAFLKRISEGQTGNRGYLPEDRKVLQTMGITSGQMAVLVLALYINGGAVTSMYSKPIWLWGVCAALLFWVSHAWLAASRGKIKDPIRFVLKDWGSYLTGLVALACILMAI